MISQLDNRVKTMNNDVIRIDTLISQVVGIRPDLDRIARADGKKDAQKRLMDIVELVNQFGLPSSGSRGTRILHIFYMEVCNNTD